MSVFDSPEWKRARRRQIYDRKYPKRPSPSRRKDLAVVAQNRAEGRQKMWARPEYREKMAHHPWRGNKVVQ